MSKLSTNTLKKMISTWLSAPGNRKELTHITDELSCDKFVACGDRPEMSEVDYTAQLFGFRTGCTSAELEEHIWKSWCDGSQWNRVEKHHLGEEWGHYLSDFVYLEGVDEPKIVPYFNIDVIGDCNMTLVEKYFNDPKLAEKCTLRVFSPKGQLADCYRLEVVTTTEDDEVIGWNVIVD